MGLSHKPGSPWEKFGETARENTKKSLTKIYLRLTMSEELPLDDREDDKNLGVSIDASFDHILLAEHPKQVRTKQKVLDKDWEESRKEKERQKNKHKVQVYDLRICLLGYP